MKSAAWRPDGERLLTVDEREVRLWNRAGELLTILRRQGRPVRAVGARFLHDGRQIITFGPDVVSVWSESGAWKRDVPIEGVRLAAADLSADEKTLSLCTGEQLIVIPFERKGTTLRFPINDCKRARVHRDGKRAAIDADGGIDFYELEKGTKTDHLPDQTNTEELIWSPADPLLVAMHKEDVNGDLHYGATFIAADKDKKLVTREIKSTLPIVFSPDGGYFLAANDDGKAEVWKITYFMDPRKNPRPVHELSHGGVADPTERYLAVVAGAAFSPDNSRLATASMGEVDSSGIRVWNVQTGTLVDLLTGQDSTLTHVEFSPDGRSLVTTDESGTGRIWRADKDLRIGRIDDAEWEAAHSLGVVVDAALGRTITLLAEDDGSGERTDAAMLIRGVRTGESRKCALGTDLNNLTVSDDGALVAVSGDYEEVRIVSTRDCSVRATIREVVPRYRRQLGCRFLPPGMLLTFRWGEARLWDINHPSAAVRVFRVPKSAAHNIDRLTVSTSAGLLVGMGKGPSGTQKATVWDLNNGAVLYTVHGSSIAVAPDGLTLAAAVGPVVNIHEPRSGRLLGSYRAHREAVTHIAYDHDGKRIVSCSNDRTAHLWDPNSRAHLSTLADNRFPVTYAAFSAQGGRIVTAANLTLRMWDAKRGTLLAVLNGHAQPIRLVRFLNDDRSLVSLSKTEVIQWDTALETRSPREVNDWIERHARVPKPVAYAKPELTGRSSSVARLPPRAHHDPQRPQA